ncbi:MAG: CHRD domain-containing protein [Acidimicrobiia bacterium]
MRKPLLLAVLVGLLVVAFIAPGASAGKDADFASPMSHAQEPGPVDAPGAGGYAEYWVDGSTLNYRITVRKLTGPATMAHIHGPGDRHESVGISIWLCGTTGGFAGPAGTPTCSSTTDGVLVEGSVTVTMEQLAMLEDKLGYTNVHTVLHPPGEVRGQVLRVGKP